MAPWVWAVLLLAVGLAIGALELFVPSGGLLAFLAISAIIGSVVMGFMAGEGIGLLMLVVVMVGVPIAIVAALRWWPRTPIGRRVLLEPQRAEDVMPDNPRRRDLKALVGRIGTARTPMLPSGAIVIDGRTFDAFSEGMPINEGDRVVVVAVHGTQVLVRPADEEAPPLPPDDPLSRPVDQVAFDPFDRPAD